MKTSPILARRVIPWKERLQKSLIALVIFALALAGAWITTGGSLDNEPVYLLSFAGAALLGLCISAYLWFKKEERAKTKQESQALRSRIEDDRLASGWISRIGYNTRRFLAGIVVLTGALVVVAGLGVLGLQVYRYLKVGEWSSMSLFDFLAPHISWLSNPQSWFGLYRIVKGAFEIMPLSLAVILVGWLIAGFGSALRQRVSR